MMNVVVRIWIEQLQPKCKQGVETNKKIVMANATKIWHKMLDSTPQIP